MALSAWDKTRIYATWYTHAGTRIPGSYVVHMPVRVTVEDGDAIVPAGIYAQGDLVTASENVPALDVMVPANNDPDVTPLGWQIRIDVTLAPPGGAKITERYVIDTPVGGEVNLRTIPLAQTIPPTQTMLLRGVAGGVAALDSQGRVVDADGNPVTGAVDPGDLETAIGDYFTVHPVPEPDLSGYVQDNDPRLTDARAPLAHAHDWDDIQNTPDLTVNLDTIPPGAMFQIEADGTGGWTYDGSTITERPTARTDVRMWAIGGTTTPTFAITGDVHVPQVVEP